MCLAFQGCNASMHAILRDHAVPKPEPLKAPPSHCQYIPLPLLIDYRAGAAGAGAPLVSAATAPSSHAWIQHAWPSLVQQPPREQALSIQACMCSMHHSCLCETWLAHTISHAGGSYRPGPRSAARCAAATASACMPRTAFSAAASAAAPAAAKTIPGNRRRRR